jgi:hypothetical protein
MDSEILDRIEKQMEGNGLALAAVAEVLQKMDIRLSKAEEDDEKDKEKEEEVEEMEWAVQEKAELVKAVAGETIELLKAGQYGGERGVPLDGEKVKSASSTGKSSSNADDSEKAVTIDTKTENVQGVIQAMQKQLDLLKEGMPWETGDAVEEDEEEEDSQDKPRADNDEEDGEKNIAYSVENIEKMVANETEKRLRKMGFKEETSLMRPTIIDHNHMGTDGGTPISKGGTLSAASGDEVVDQLASLSYKQLRDLQMQVESGETDGVPKELIQS